MAESDRLMKAWYRDRWDVKTQARFASRCAKWSMIRAAFGAMNAAETELDESMGGSSDDREFRG